ncbi:MAG TPA: hypothetical protein VFO34_14785 [Candidatus Acidoferrales bacterium]|nr:hypothetical protein [Candidatus Acidoferrales bacterium]
MIRKSITTVSAFALLAALLAIAPSAVFPQDPGAPPPGGQHGGRRGPGPGGFAFDGMGPGFGGRTVTGAPFSATLTVSHTPGEGGGNGIANNSTGSIVRDTQGRTRRDMQLSGIGPLHAQGTPPHMIFINDPVSHSNYMLNADKKTGEQFSLNGNMPPPPPLGMNSGQHGEGGFGARGRGEVTTQSLGTKTINGVSANGTLITRNTPNGSSTVERWFSPDLQTVVSETRTDPRFGTTSMQLTNINRGEPDPSLFSVPSDFTITQGHFGHGGRGGRRGPGGPGGPGAAN